MHDGWSLWRLVQTVQKVDSKCFVNTCGARSLVGHTCLHAEPFRQLELHATTGLTKSGVYTSFSASRKVSGSCLPPGSLPLLHTIHSHPSGRLSAFIVQFPDGCPPYISSTVFFPAGMPNSSLTWKSQMPLSFLLRCAGQGRVRQQFTDLQPD